MILITEFMDEAAVGTLRTGFDVTYAPGLADAQDDIPSRIAKTQALIVRNRTQVTKALLAAAPALKCVGRLGVGLDNIDVEACKARGVAVFPALGANTLSVVEYVISAAMMLLRGAYQVNVQMIAGGWPRQECSGRELAGKRLGLVGFGAIAQDTAKAAQALGVRICAHDPFIPAGDVRWGGVENVTLDALLETADIVSLHVPLTSDTRHLMNAERLARMKPGAVLVNAARGGVVDEDALVVAMRAGQLAGAALDVFENEPLSTADGRKFAGLSNLILTPHVGGVTEESNQRVSVMIAEKISQHLNGEA
jgi:(S)-sulfolactate dehydrogenase